MYCSWADAQLDEDYAFLKILPTEIRSLIQRAPASQYLETLADSIKVLHYTDLLFPLYKPLLPELLARWTRVTATTDVGAAIAAISCLARVLPLATYLRAHVKAFLRTDHLRNRLLNVGLTSSDLSDDALHSFFLALFRLLSFDRDMLTGTVTPLFLASFLRHKSLPVRYLAVQCLCLVMHFADAFSEHMVAIHIGTESVWGDWEGKRVDYRLLKLWEERRWMNLTMGVALVEQRWQAATLSIHSGLRTLTEKDLSSRTANVGGVLHPRPDVLETQLSTFVLTSTAQHNLNLLGNSLLEPKPILLSGQAGSGKTSLVHEAARLLNKLSSMITLHLNEQTDAKSLLGVHTSSSDGKSFTWQAGVLTKAIQQGRWVLIEDIDRAPAEVMGVLRPILENGELFLANRKERVRPTDGFRILATLKTEGHASLAINSRTAWLLNPRLWSTVEVAAYAPVEIEALLRSRYPLAEPFIGPIMKMHQNLSTLYKDHQSLRLLKSRAPSLRDLLNLCRRVVRRLRAHGQVSPSTALPERTKFEIFKDAVDCYAGYLHDNGLHELVAGSIALDMGISPQQMHHCLHEEFTTVSETNDEIIVGRSSLQKVSTRRRQLKTAPFALTSTAQLTLDRISASASCSEPCLLVGETGVGKTTLVQYVANLVSQKLTVVNMSQQSEASDLLGGLKPVTTRSLILPLVEKFDTLFDDTFSTKRNEKFQIAIAKAVAKQNWSRLTILWNEAIQMAAASLNAAFDASKTSESHVNKRRKLEMPKYELLRSRWTEFGERFKQIRSYVDHGEKDHTFAFVEGRLVQAVRDGEWLLLDEINLAPSDTLDYIVSLLHNGDEERPSLLLAETGNIETIVAHPNFRIFAAMNPATDAGKKDLPSGLRSRFTEVYVPSGDGNLDDLTKIIQTYLGALLDNDKRAALDLAKTYLEVKRLNQEHKLTDGAGETPHFSIRSLVRCLLYVVQHSASHGLRRAMYEGFAMSFFTVLSRASENMTQPFLEKYLLSSTKNRKSFLSQQPKIPYDQGEFVAFRHHLVKKGQLTPDLQPHYIRTPSVERNLLNLARAASMRRFPILLQGPTSAGKTSMVEYLAKLSGNKFVRINNHEHTDLQEYLGSYVSDAGGKLVYREGVLVDALRQGHWIVLDELNLAPSDVLEALNRLLDDNRELLIPESQEIVRPHPNFMLFATQNPAGLYGGRKRLSRAFRNRFLEIHFDDLPEEELEIILRERAQIAPSFCTQIVAVYKQLSLQRQSSKLFEQRNSFATLRDLFRWAARPVDDRQQLAQHGFMLLAERVREPAERAVVKTTIEKTMKVVIDENALYGLPQIPSSVQRPGSIVWTSAMRRVFVLAVEALKNNEPLLLVGETGCGKTQICQVVAEALGRPLDIYNAHTNTETGDLIGSQRPIRNRSELGKKVLDSWRVVSAQLSGSSEYDDLSVDEVMDRFSKMDQARCDPEALEQLRSSIGEYQSLFTWSDGSLVRAMKRGDHFLLDEISLAEDSVLERLNSVLEPSRTILLAEKGSTENLVIARPEFQFLATMNPGGDYGKRELSAALRNRLTEIWVPPLSEADDIVPIVQNKLKPAKRHLAEIMLKFTIWFRNSFHSTASKNIPLRDLLAWADFVNYSDFLEEETALVQGCFMIYVDSIGANPAGMTALGAIDLTEARNQCLEHLQTLVGMDVLWNYRDVPKLTATDQFLSVGPFSLPRIDNTLGGTPELVFEAPTTRRNTMRIVRALQMTRPILLEGSPGVGKTAIVTALAQACGKQFTRINLSDQTDLMDLFGADAPAEDEQMGNFSWQNGPLLDAMQSGGWVLLDEMNLASQSVLEGLNSCLDHRREAYIAELDKSFTCHPEFILFAAQNPHHQGGGRKGLPASFVNRFTVVYADSFQHEDLMTISQAKFPEVAVEQLESVIKTVAAVENAVARSPAFSLGGPWELNLRDVNRWLQLCQSQPTLQSSYHFHTIVKERFRTQSQRDLALQIAAKHSPVSEPESLYNNVTPTTLQVGTAALARDDVIQNTNAPNLTLSATHLHVAKSVITAINQNWPVILVGPTGSGKTSVIRSLAAASGVQLVEFSMNADVDTMDLVGGFEQYDILRDIITFQHLVREALRQRIAASMRGQSNELSQQQLLQLWHVFETEQPRIDDLKATFPTLLAAFPDLQSSVDALSTRLASADALSLRFVWNDGILVDAVEGGSWLVLDNANLCNPSVLDRLNSLLEPGGLLAISEQHGGSNGTRVIKPHPNFRIFLTMDPRSGELSRAMRNRSLEICMPTLQNEQPPDAAPIKFPYASRLNRLRHLCDAACQYKNRSVLEAFVDNLDEADMALVIDSQYLLPTSAGNEALASEWTIRQSFQAQDVYRLVPSHFKAGWPQLVTLNEPQIMLGGSFGHQLPIELFAEPFTGAWYIVRQIAEIRSALKQASARAATLAMKDRTILEKSAAAVVNQKDVASIPRIAAFASLLCSKLLETVQAVLQRTTDRQLLGAAKRILIFTQQILQICDTKTVEIDQFRTYLQVGAHLARSLEGPFPTLSSSFSECLNTLSTRSSRQKTGFGLQLMWQMFKPKTAETFAQFKTQLALEELIAKFDLVCRSLPHSRRSLSAIRSKLQHTYSSIVQSTQPEDSLLALEGAVSGLEHQSQRGLLLEGNFQRSIEYLYQTLKLRGRKHDEPDLEVLAMFIPETNRDLRTFEEENQVPRSLNHIASVNASLLLDEAGVGLDLSKQLLSVEQQRLGLLDHAKEELHELARALTSHADVVGTLVRPLHEHLEVIVSGIMFSHYDLLTENGRSCFRTSGSLDLALLARLSSDEVVLPGSSHDQFREVYTRFLYPALILLQDTGSFGLLHLKESLVKLSVAGLALIVPDPIFDPAMYPKVEHHLHQCQAAELTSRIEGQMQFVKHVAGQETSLVIRILENERQDLGTSPLLPTVVRPEKGELSQLQDVFTRIVSVIAGDQNGQAVHSLASGSPEWIKHWSTNRGISNLKTIIERLERSHRAYDDFVKPVVWFLKWLSFGLELETTISGQNHERGEIKEVITNTPLMGAGPDVARGWVVSQTSTPNLRFQWLEYVGLRIGSTTFDNTIFSENLLEILDRFYQEWKLRLTKDQAEAATRSRYYTYRGEEGDNDEAESEEMRAMFPQFDGEESESREFDGTYDARGTAVRLASLHQRIVSEKDSQQTLRELVLGALATLPKLEEKMTGVPEASFVQLLPAILLQMESKLNGLNGVRSAVQKVNIYSDSDLGESRKLFNLVHQIQSRFHAIHERWPEHAVPAEVISFCAETLHLNLGDPVAKLLTKTEKLHEIVSQWQSVASREWSVGPLIEELSTLIISWRRLELLSWSSLLDDEKQRHEEDANAWYFMAYETVIYNSRRMVDDAQDTESYRRELVQALEGFLKTTTLGQYASRLALLHTLSRTMKNLSGENHELSKIGACIDDVLRHYRRYQPSIDASLQARRSELEKTLNEQIKLASWKDTNITALRESARRSHHKLFKIVRKYRALLNQAVVLNPPDDSEQLASPQAVLAELVRPQYEGEEITAAEEQCRLVIEDWATRPERLTKPLGATRSMHHLYTTRMGEFQVHAEVSLFRQDLRDMIKELRAQTPATLTEENTSLVRHLHERKRRLLADTLKEVSQMGVRRNLPTSELGQQSSRAVVLSSLADRPISEHSATASAANKAFHDLLDAMPQARQARTGHSDDLTEGEIGRSIGLLEGLLFLTVNQRRAMPKHTAELDRLSAQLSMLRSFKESAPNEALHWSSSESTVDTVQQHLAWLSEILLLSHQILSFQARQASLDIEELLDSLRSHGDLVKHMRESLCNQPKPPTGLMWKSSKALLDRTSHILSELTVTLTEWEVREPRVGFLLKQIIPWTEELSEGRTNIKDRDPDITLQQFDLNLKTALDQIFVALQRLSSQQAMPNSVETQGWLSKSDKLTVEGLKLLQMSTITTTFEECVTNKLHNLATSDLAAARNLLVVALPVIEQYFYICENILNTHTANHLETCRLGLQLSKSFTSLASQGFCNPREPDDGKEQSGKLESGTGLGDGEGAEDISKDVGDDEDLSELAQSGQKEEEDGEMEDAQDAVDMGHDELEGEMGDRGEQEDDQNQDGDRSGDEDEDEIDEETGSVDDLDPDVVDEKMWDDMKNESEKDKEMKNDDAKGKRSDDQTAAEGEKNEGEDMEGVEGEEMPEEDEDEGEGVQQSEAEHMDPHVDEEKALDLPEELQLAGEEEAKDDDISDDGMDELSDMDQPADEETGEADADEINQLDKSFDGAEDDEAGAEDEEMENGLAQDNEVLEDQPPEENEDKADEHDTREDDVTAPTEETAGGESGAANELQETIDPDQKTEGMNEPQQETNEKPTESGKAPENDDQGESGKGAFERGAGRTDTLEHQQDEALRKLADVLDQWHQRREILPTSEEQRSKDQNEDVDMADADFEHLQDEDEGDAQALGAATADQAQNLDPSTAIEDEEGPVNEDTDIPDVLEPEEQDTVAERFNRLQGQARANQARDAGAFIPNESQQRNEHDHQQEGEETASDDLSPDIENLDLSTKPDLDALPTSTADAAQLWHQCASSTHQFALVLTEQLRLILSPTTATKLRGDYRTGKRLNIKRIIPYIASNYKRDKIWMRRAVPSKRNYQIMIAVDDSKSMSEAGADVLAFETLALLTTSLAMLEVGELCVVAFGDEPHVKVAHPFGAPFAPAESGPRVFQAFGFEQRGTDVRSLVAQSIRLFRDARAKSSAADAAEQWQLGLIVSDGHCSDHAGVAQLVRQAEHEDKIIFVFVIVDAGPESILDLKEAVFEPDPMSAVNGPDGSGAREMRVRTKRYLDGFPFPYYLVVRDVRDLPGVLATALKGWFGSVVDAQG